MPRDREILAAAERLFGERGYHAVGIDEIGEHAGITGPAIYRHFSGKDEILATLFDEAVDALLARTGTREFSPAEPEEELRYLARCHAQFVLEKADLTVIMLRDDSSLSPAYRRRYRRRQAPYVARWHGCVQRLIGDADASRVTSVTFGSLAFLTSVASWPPDGRRAPGLVELLADYVLGGIGALSRPAAAGTPLP